MFGRYRLCGRLAAGGMAEVWAAQLLAPGGFVKPMVIKRVLPELAQNPSFLKMLMTEARVAARLTHANVCSVFELGEVDGEYFIAMEYLRGAPLSHVLRNGGPVPPAAAVAMIVQACDGLHYAPEQRDGQGTLLGLVHRDVSPHNLFVTVDGVTKILDFGIAKVDDGISERTEDGKVKGKLTYMSPEQLAAESIDRRTDVWALGVVLWELLTGRRLFGSGGPAETVDGIRNGKVPRLAELGPEFERLDAVLARALAVDRARRFATAMEFRRSLVEALAPTSPATTDELARMAWERCRDEVLVNDARFDGVDEPPLERLVERLPLRADETEPSISRAETLTPDTSPEIEIAVATPVQAPPVPDLAPRSPSPSRRRWGVPALLVMGAAALAVVMLRDRGRAGDSPPPPPASAPAVAVVTPMTPSIDAAAAAPIDAAPTTVEVGAAQVEPPPPTPSPAPVARRPPRPPAAKPGKLFINANPWATIYVDGKKVGPTPIVDHTLSAGSHTIRAVAEDGRTRSLRIEVPPGGEVRKKVVW
jgi:serine/threonine-protein kinase